MRAETPAETPAWNAPEPCPVPWCRVEHHDRVEHESGLRIVAMDELGDVDLIASILQLPGEAPRLNVGACKGVACVADMDLSLAAAEVLVARLQALITAARG